MALTIAIHSFYRTTNIINNKTYFGIHNEAISQKYIGSGTILKQAIKKYGKENFIREVLVLGDKEYCLSIEEKWVNVSFIKLPDNYNIAIGGGCPPSSWKGKKFGPLLQETKDKLSAINKGNKLSDETKRKISLAGKGRIVSQEPRDKISDANKGRIVSDEHKRKLSESHKGKKHSLETCVKLSERNVSKIKVICPHCGTIGGKNVMSRWHFDNCRVIKQGALI